MRSGRRKSSPPPPLSDEAPANSAAPTVFSDREAAASDHREIPEAEEEDDEEDDEIADENDDESAAAELSGDPPKLEEGFYEIEDIRRKRVRKGEIQYLIKWRGWPETDNTWEPFENLKSCADFIEVFEKKSSRSRGRKRRRKSNGVGNTIIRRKPRSARNDETETPPIHVEMNQEEREDKIDEQQVVEEADVNGGNEIDEQKKDWGKESGCISIQLNSTGEEEGSVEDGSSKVEFSHPVGSKKRKSGSVRRFQKDLVHDGHDEDHHNAVVVGEKVENEGVDSNENEEEIGNKTHRPVDSVNPPTVTRILKPVCCNVVLVDSVQQVFVTFKALMSDGREVLVDNKDLKLNNPLLLIGYYEQHLHCGPHS